ncbi:Homeodomain-like protein [Venturia nashicola]|nr:Homeodomain-like protein [Venturia nashicola]
MDSGKRDEEENFSDGSEYVPKATPRRRQRTASVERSPKREETAEESSTSTQRPVASKSSQSRLRKYIRLKGCYNDDYRKLLNTTISEAAQIVGDDDLDNLNPMLNLPPSALGGTSWATDEKRIFYHAVARYGRDNLPRIASSLNNKSEQEVRAYCDLMQNSLLQHARSEQGGLKSASHDMYAAIEVSDECLEELDTCADALAWYQFTWEAKQEQKSYGQFWLLDREMADEVTMALSEDGDDDGAASSAGQSESSDSSQNVSAVDSSSRKASRTTSGLRSPEVLNPVPAADFLNLSHFIELSEKVFMNSKDPDWDWRSFQDPGKPDKSYSKLSRAEESPAIFRTAFDDFHRVAVSLTKRIVHAALFQAMSRLRAKDNTERSLASDPRVERRDVLAALEILNLRRNSFEHWATLPRRHKVDWLYQIDADKKSKNRQVTAEEAEKYLRHEGRISHSEVEKMFQAGAAASPGWPDSQDGNSEPNYESVDEMPATLSYEQAVDPYDQYLEFLDLQASQMQERQVWGLLGKDAPRGANSSGVVEAKIPKAIPTIEQGTSSFADWRAWTECRAKWEMEESGTSEDEAVESEDDQSAVEEGVTLSWISIPQTVHTRDLESDPAVEWAERAPGDVWRGGRWNAINVSNGTKRRHSQTVTTGPQTVYDMEIPFRKRHEEFSPGEMEEAQRSLGDEPAWVTQDIPPSDGDQESNRSPSPGESVFEAEEPRFDDSE